MKKSLFALSFSKNIANYNRMKFNITVVKGCKDRIQEKKKNHALMKG